MIEDKRSKYFVFVPFCLLAQAYQAQGIVKYEWIGTIKPFIELLLAYDINIIQMPCAESSFNRNLIREAKGIKKYDTLQFNAHCEKLADDVAKEIKQIEDSGYKVLAILGNEKRQGLFMEKLTNKLKNFSIPVIGINRKYINKSLQQLKEIVKKVY